MRSHCSTRYESRFVARRKFSLAAGVRLSRYLIPITIDSGPSKCSTRASRKPASFIQPMQSLPV